MYEIDYTLHDKFYQIAKKNGESGWGGEKSNYRYNSWMKTLDSFSDYSFLPKKGKLLDLGCGNGHVSLYMAKKGYEVYGIDISETAIEWAKERAETEKINAEYFARSVIDLSFLGSDHFDIIIDANCLHCIIGKDRKILLNEVYRVLKSGGFFFVSTQCGITGYENLKYDFDEESKIMTVNNIAYRYFGNPENVIEEIKESRFKIMESTIDFNENKHLKLFACKQLSS